MSEEVNTNPATPPSTENASTEGSITIVTTPQNYTVTVQQPAQQPQQPQQVRRPIKKVIG